jgi:hypothetical protein
MDNEELVIINPNTEVSYQQDRAIIDSQVATAKAYPRDIKRAIANSIAIVTMDAETAATCTYSVPRGGKPITGPSVHMARMIVQQWGNIRAEAKVIDVTNKHVVSQAVCYDLETNVAVKVEVRRSILTRNGKMSDDMITVTGNAANAIAYRNAVFNVVPKSVVDKVYKAATGLLTGDISDETKLIKRRNQVVEQLKKSYGVTEEEILASVGKSQIEYIGSDEIVVLIGIGTAIKEGDTTVDQAFRPSQAKVPTTKTSVEDAESKRLIDFIGDCKDIKLLEAVFPECTTEAEIAAYEAQFDKLTPKK